jgi:hypothetical protein
MVPPGPVWTIEIQLSASPQHAIVDVIMQK